VLTQQLQEPITESAQEDKHINNNDNGNNNNNNNNNKVENKASMQAYVLYAKTKFRRIFPKYIKYIICYI
jgi:hypothetical protein